MRTARCRSSTLALRLTPPQLVLGVEVAEGFSEAFAMIAAAQLVRALFDGANLGNDFRNQVVDAAVQRQAW